MVFAKTYTGELPLEIIRMKAKRVVGLEGNMGFTLPSNIGELGDDITNLDLSSCSLTGRLSTRAERVISATETGAVILQGLCLRFSLLRLRFLI